MRRYLLSLLLLVVATAKPVHTQTKPAQIISGEGAMQALHAAKTAAEKQGLTMSIAVVDAAGDLLAFTRMDGASPASVTNALGKARTSARFRRATEAIDSAVVSRPGLMTFEGLTAVGGGVPVILEGVVIGAIGASGGTPVQDATVARTGVAVIVP